MKQYRINELMLYREYEQEEDQILQDLGEIINSLEEEEDLAYLDEKERREFVFFLPAQTGGDGRNLRIFRKSVALLSDLPSGKQ